MFDCIEGDAARMPVPGASFDLACIGFGLRNVVEWRQALSEMARAVRPGGLVVVLEFSTPPRGPIRRLYLSYFLRLLPRIGNRLSRSQAYRYLPESVMAWPEPQALSSAMEQAGLMSVVCRRLTFGIACLHIGRRGA
ncbi:MAG: Ubiquinone/menaquinone biosynthesis C-methyltransferase UbiE [candidate division BRC1 bacterium ADurb.BinA364]|nr:MAG: Ubiquinone/menaquinone biosynthesis C-methyltransferase UbiE [candidate division BRC1 bacterium ADurb.BinA364]